MDIQTNDKIDVEWLRDKFHYFTYSNESFVYSSVNSSIFQVDSRLKPYFISAEENEKKLIPSEPDKEIAKELNKFLGLQSNLIKESDPDQYSHSPIASLVLLISAKCNLNCVYCYADKGKYSGKSVSVEINKVKEIVDYFVNHSSEEKNLHITFFGGEPLIDYPKLKVITEYATDRTQSVDKKLTFSVTTNGTLFSEEIVTFLNKHHFHVTISIDGAQEDHDKARPFPSGKGSFEKISKNLEILQKFYNAGPLAARVTVTRQNLNLMKTFAQLESLGFHHVGFSIISSDDPELMFDADDYKEFIKKFKTLIPGYIQRLRAKKGASVSSMDSLLKTFVNGEVRSYPCGAAIGLAGIDAKGEIYLCQRFFGNSSFKLGNIYDGIDLKKRMSILNKGSTSSSNECNKCWAQSVCGGGCYYDRFLHNRDIGEPVHQHCNYYKDMIQIALDTYVYLKKNDPKLLSGFAA